MDTPNLVKPNFRNTDNRFDNKNYIVYIGYFCIHLLPIFDLNFIISTNTRIQMDSSKLVKNNFRSTENRFEYNNINYIKIKS